MNSPSAQAGENLEASGPVDANSLTVDPRVTAHRVT
jgi:hypothetical protein